MKDVIDHNFAAIWLTAAELSGPLCQPPRLTGNPLLRAESAAAMDLEKVRRGPHSIFRSVIMTSVDEIAQKHWYRLFGHVPDIGHCAYAIAASVREGDPNVGKPPRDTHLHPDELGAYVTPDSEAAGPLDLVRLSGRNHLGGTMFPSQWTPKFSRDLSRIRSNISADSISGAAMPNSISRQ